MNMQLLSVSNVVFELFGYQMSLVELLGTILNLWCVYLVTKKKILNWPIGILGVIFFGILFYQIQLYSDFIEQIYYLVTGFYGWWLWTRDRKDTDEMKVETISSKGKGITIGLIGVLTFLLGSFIARIHVLFPVMFPIAASLPYLDAFTTVMSFVANLLMAWRKVENWILWIVVDIIGVFLYMYKGVMFVSLLYFVFLVLATKGFIDWRKSLIKQGK